MFSDSWWSQEVRFLQPKEDRPPYQVDSGLKTLAAGSAQIVVGAAVGLAAAKFLQSNMGHYVVRSLVRGLIYRQVRALSK